MEFPNYYYSLLVALKYPENLFESEFHFLKNHQSGQYLVCNSLFFGR